MNPLAALLTDGYKTGHHLMYPKNLTAVYSNLTPRSNKYAPRPSMDKVVSIGQQMVMSMLDTIFREHFFDVEEDEAIDLITKEFSLYLGAAYDASHFRDLHQLGYLPIRVKALPEGTMVPIGVPLLTIENTDPNFGWVTNYLETILSNLLWKPITSATIAREYYQLFKKHLKETDPDNMWFLDFQGHDFSMRGLDSVGATIASGLGHAAFFTGSDSLPVIYGARKYYNHPENEPVIMSVNATEHSVMSAGTGLTTELDTFKRLLKTFPSGILAVVSDTFDLWKVCTGYLPVLKKEILGRDGKLVIRPDSGDPVEILCGTGKPHASAIDHPRQKGVVELLWDVFGGTTNKQGYKVLDPHIGAIYGDSITIDRAEAICNRLRQKGFATSNVVLGIGSFTYQYNTRDTFGFAMKATYCEVHNGEDKDIPMDEKPGSLGHPTPTIRGIDIYKDPITDDGTKKSAKGLLCVEQNADGEYFLMDKVTREREQEGHLQKIYEDGIFANPIDFQTLRDRARGTVA